MELMLDEIEARVLGCLMEKEMTTPEYYPLSLNALTNACNQKSNRDPVMALTEDNVAQVLDALRFKQLAVVSADGGRVPKYRHLLAEQLRLVPAELAVLCELLVRGPQTPGELRARCERMHSFPDIAALEQVLSELAGQEPPMVIRLPRQPGRKESRYAHTFLPLQEGGQGIQETAAESGRAGFMSESARLAGLEDEVRKLKDDMAELRKVLDEFRLQFE